MNYPVIKAEIAKFSADGFRRSSRGLGQEVTIGLTRTQVVRDTDDARELAQAALPGESRYLDGGDYVAFRTFVDYGPSHHWMGEREQYRFDQQWERLTPSS